SRAEAILSLDADFLGAGPFAVRHARQWAARRRTDSPAQTPSRLAMVESQLSVTGSMADDRLARPTATVPQVARAVAARLALPAPVLPEPGGPVQTFDELVGDMRAGHVDTLLILDTNPLYTAPADLGFGVALDRVRDSICLALYEHETAQRCRWFAPAPHFLEAWGDGRAYDGTVSMAQPLVQPLIDARGPAELLSALAGDPSPDPHRLAHDFWTHDRGLGETAWQRALQLGVQSGTAAAAVDVAPNPAAVARAVASLPMPSSASGQLAIELYPSPTL